MDCARALVQSGIVVLVAYQPDFDDPKWGDDFKNVVVLLGEAGVAIRYVEGTVQRAGAKQVHLSGCVNAANDGRTCDDSCPCYCHKKVGL